MTAIAPVSLFTASDGRPFDVHWASEANSRELWHWNNSHYPGRLTPLHAWVMGHGSGRDRAYAEAGIDPPHMFREFEIHHGFHFIRQSPYQGEQLASFVARSRALSGKHGGACNVWEAFCLARVEAAAVAMRNAPVSIAMDELADLFGYAFHTTHVGGPAVFAPIQARLAALLSTRFDPDEVALLVQEIGQGADSATLESDRALGRLAELARADPAIAAAVAGASDEALASLRDIEGATAFHFGLASYLETYGVRTERWGIDSPTLAERPQLVIDMIRQSMAAPPRNDPALRQKALSMRDAAVHKMEAAFDDDAGAIATIRAAASELERMVFVREGRALRQLTSAGGLRGTVLRKGDALVEAGVIRDRSDILFLAAEEIDAFFGTGVRASLSEAVAERKRIHDSWAGVAPPPVISADPAAVIAGHATPEAGVLRGLPGSRGRVTGLARLALELDDGDTLEPGEILVCVTTSPPWTPLFALASAIVTDSGYALSHAAIAAREYGIPAVVGTNEATRRIRTGDTIEVNGDAGTVTIVARGS